jgi:hypothetical protein
MNHDLAMQAATFAIRSVAACALGASSAQRILRCAVAIISMKMHGRAAHASWHQA